jgi:hypothetical protein
MWTRWLGILALCILTLGCQLANNAAHNLSYEAKLSTAAALEHCTYEKLARASWDKVQQTEDGEKLPKEYAQGFKDGFVDYLQFGGSGQPPYVPPKQYWGPYFRTPKGHQAVDDWYVGFRHGAAVAQQTGYREWATLPSAATTERTGNPVGPIDPGSGIPLALANHPLAAPQKFAPPILLAPSESPAGPTPQASTLLLPSVLAVPSVPVEAAAAPAPQASTLRLPSVLAVPSVPVGGPVTLQFPEPAWTIEIVEPTKDVGPSTLGLPRPIVPIVVPMDTIAAPTLPPAPAAENGQTLVFPAARATFGIVSGHSGLTVLE